MRIALAWARKIAKHSKIFIWRTIRYEKNDH